MELPTLLDNMMGVYSIINKLNNKRYVGSSKNIKSRIHSHISYLNANTHHNEHLQNAWNKYGKDSFKFEIVEQVDTIDNLLEREQYWIDKYKVVDRNLGYNILPIALTSGRIIPNETRIKISNALKGTHKASKFGEDHGNSKLTDELVKEIYKKVSNGQSITELSNIYNIDKSVIYKIIGGSAWSHLKLKPIERVSDSYKLTEKDVYEIKLKLKSGAKIKELAKLYNVNRSTIESIKNNKIWKNVLPDLNIEYQKQIPYKRKKLNVSDVIKIKKMLIEKISTKEIAKLFNVSIRTIQEIKSNKSWKDVVIKE